MDIPVLKVESRKAVGKQPTTKLRHAGRIPAVCYGRGKDPLALSVDPDALMEILRGPRGLNSLIKLDGSSDDRTVFVQEVQKHPVERNLLHVDFIHVDPEKPVVRSVPVELSGRPEGVKLGGVLQFTRRELAIETRPANIPEKIVLEVDELLVGQSIHIEDVELPEGVKAIYDRNYAICAIVAPTEEKEEEPPAEEAAEGALAEGEEAPEGEEGEEKKAGEEKKEESAEKKPEEK